MIFSSSKKSEINQAASYNAYDYTLNSSACEELEEACKKFHGRNLEESDLPELIEITKNVLPQETILEIKKIIRREVDAPIILRNVPKLEWNDKLAAIVKADEEKAISLSAAYLLSRGIFALFGCDHRKTVILTRQPVSAEHKGPSYLIHRDKPLISAISSLNNEVHAETYFINVKNALLNLPLEVKKRLKILSPHISFNGPITLAELEQEIDRIRYDTAYYNQGITLLENVDAKDKGLFEKAIDEQTIKVDVQPGMLVIWESAYHQARRGKTEGSDSFGGRAVIYSGAHNPIND